MNSPWILEQEELSDDLLNALIDFALHKTRKGKQDYRTIMRGDQAIEFTSRPFYCRELPIKAFVIWHRPGDHADQEITFRTRDDIKQWIRQNLDVDQYTRYQEFSARQKKLWALRDTVVSAVRDKLQRARFSIPGVRVRHDERYHMIFETEDGEVILQMCPNIKVYEDK